jgi:hypothetical protein
VDQHLEVVAAAGFGDPGADRDPRRHGVALRRLGRHPRPDALGDLGGGRRVGLREHEQELLAAVARGEVGAAQRGAEDRRESTQNLVAGQVPEGVVEALEVIDVDHRHRQRPPVAPAALDLGLERLHQVLAVRQAGEAVGDRQLVQLGVARAQAGTMR